MHLKLKLEIKKLQIFVSALKNLEKDASLIILIRISDTEFAMCITSKLTACVFLCPAA